MIILIPLGGTGTRFQNADYKLPKPLINVMGKPIINWLLDNLVIADNLIVYIPYNKVLSKYNFESKLRKDYPSINFVFHQMQTNTEGAAQTIAIALDAIQDRDDSPIISLDGDTFYHIDIINQWKGENKIFIFNDISSQTCYSYVKTSEKDTIQDIAEKEKISNYACTGAYGFNSWKLLRTMCHTVINKNIKTKNEYYISNVIKLMIKSYEYTFQSHYMAKNNFVCLGTPLDIRIFCANYDKVALTSTVNNNPLCKLKRFCFDLDNTLVSYPKVTDDYRTVEPISRTITLVRQLKLQGHTILIHTARRMKTHNGNSGKVLSDIGKITFETLEKFEIPYDEIYFGKPHADFYIDDLAVSAFDELDKTLGFYDDNQVNARNFNNMTALTMDIFRKSSHDLSGEIYYYDNIPENVKNFFPIMMSYDPCKTWYNVERINGVTLSKLYVTETLTKSLLEQTIHSIHKIHKSVTINNEIEEDIYANYINKLKNRAMQFDYKTYFQDADDVMFNLMHHHDMYEIQKGGQIAVIHGDPVFTNIIVNAEENLKFIDMRGELNDKLSIFGDALYDWAKVFQSLIGYDEIIENKIISDTYKEKMIECFKNTLKYDINISDKQFDYIKIITKSLLFTLIPLHVQEKTTVKNGINAKCFAFYNLINSKYLA